MMTKILSTYFLSPKRKLRELLRIEEKRDIQSSKLSSKQFFTISSSAPSKKLKLLMTCRVRKRIFYLRLILLDYYSSAEAKTWKRTGRICEESLYRGSSVFVEL